MQKINYMTVSPSVLWHCWLGVRKSIRPVKKWVMGVLAWLSVWSVVQMICIWPSWCHCHPIISCFSKIQNGLPFWCRLTQVVLEKRPLNVCMYVCNIYDSTAIVIIFKKIFRPGTRSWNPHLMINEKNFSSIQSNSNFKLKVNEMSRMGENKTVKYTDVMDEVVTESRVGTAKCTEPVHRII